MVLASKFGLCKRKAYNNERSLTFVPLITNNDEVQDVCADAVQKDADATDHQRSWTTTGQHTLLIADAVVLFSAEYQNKHRADDQHTKYLQTANIYRVNTKK